MIELGPISDTKNRRIGVRRLISILGLGIVALALSGAGALWTYFQFRYTHAFVLHILAASTDAQVVVEGTGIRINAGIPPWAEPFMLDLSLVTPGLVVYTGLCMLSGCWYLLRRGAGTATARTEFPFPGGSKAAGVQSGLIGTVFGMILAFHNADRQAQDQAQILLEALGTALWSTLTALVFAFFVWPFLSLLYRRLTWSTFSSSEDPFVALATRAGSTAMALDALGSSVAVLHTKIDVQVLVARTSALETQVGLVTTQQKDLSDNITALRRALESMTLKVDTIDSGQQATMKRVSKQQDDLEQLTARVNIRASRWRRVVKTLEDNVRRIHEALSRMSDWS